MENQFIITDRVTSGGRFDWDIVIVAVANSHEEAIAKVEKLVEKSGKPAYQSEFNIVPVTVGTTVYEFRY